VLDSGRLKEFDEPHLLLQNRLSYFSRLVEQTGSIAAAELAQTARQAYILRHRPHTHHLIPDSVRSHLSSYIPVSGFTDLQLVSNV
ncbi:Multidrug resistance-associated protein 4, partial [Desmophyllum pertusum]